MTQELPGTPGMRVFERVLLVGALVALTAAAVAFSDNELRVDEQIHSAQIESLAGGNWQLDGRLTTLPGFHLIIAGLARATGRVDLSAVRFDVFLVSLATVATFAWLARGRKAAHLKTLQFVFLPILFPQFFLIYTDVASLLFVLLMLLAADRRHYAMAGVLGVASCLMRQNNVVWVVLVCLWSYLQEYGWQARPWRESMRRLWPFALSLGLLAAIVVVTRGEVALGDAGAHPLSTVHIGNVFFALFLAFFLFLPLWWAHRRETLRRLGRKWTWILLMAALALFWFGFSNDHPYNREQGDFFIHNGLLIFFTSSWLLKLAFFVPVALTLVSLRSVRLTAHAWLLYPVTVAFLLPSWLIEQRYYLIPFTLFLLVREPVDKRAEWVQTGLSFALSVALFLPIERGDLFL
ncbi:MAG: hypothetical protein ABL986_13565 [Vicinamibacterales bacterium]